MEELGGGSIQDRSQRLKAAGAPTKKSVDTDKLKGEIQVHRAGAAPYPAAVARTDARVHESLVLGIVGEAIEAAIGAPLTPPPKKLEYDSPPPTPPMITVNGRQVSAEDLQKMQSGGRKSKANRAAGKVKKTLNNSQLLTLPPRDADGMRRGAGGVVMVYTTEDTIGQEKGQKVLKKLEKLNNESAPAGAAKPRKRRKSRRADNAPSKGPAPAAPSAAAPAPAAAVAPAMNPVRPEVGQAREIQAAPRGDMEAVQIQHGPAPGRAVLEPFREYINGSEQRIRTQLDGESSFPLQDAMRDYEQARGNFEEAESAVNQAQARLGAAGDRLAVALDRRDQGGAARARLDMTAAFNQLQEAQARLSQLRPALQQASTAVQEQIGAGGPTIRMQIVQTESQLAEAKTVSQSAARELNNAKAELATARSSLEALVEGGQDVANARDRVQQAVAGVRTAEGNFAQASERLGDLTATLDGLTKRAASLERELGNVDQTKQDAPAMLALAFRRAKVEPEQLLMQLRGHPSDFAGQVLGSLVDYGILGEDINQGGRLHGLFTEACAAQSEAQQDLLKQKIGPAGLVPVAPTPKSGLGRMTQGQLDRAFAAIPHGLAGQRFASTLAEGLHEESINAMAKISLESIAGGEDERAVRSMTDHSKLCTATVTNAASGKSPRQKDAVVRFYMRVCEECLARGDFNSANGIWAGILEVNANGGMIGRARRERLTVAMDSRVPKQRATFNQHASQTKVPTLAMLKYDLEMAAGSEASSEGLATIGSVRKQIADRVLQLREHTTGDHPLKIALQANLPKPAALLHALDEQTVPEELTYGLKEDEVRQDPKVIALVAPMLWTAICDYADDKGHGDVIGAAKAYIALGKSSTDRGAILDLDRLLGGPGGPLANNEKWKAGVREIQEAAGGYVSDSAYDALIRAMRPVVRQVFKEVLEGFRREHEGGGQPAVQ